MSTLLKLSDPARRRVPKAIVIGVVAGVMSMIMKRGWETVLPPRLPSQPAPPVTMLGQLGIDISPYFYTYSENHINIPATLVVFTFSTFWALVYCVGAEYFPQIKLWSGVAFGLFVQIAFHIILLPALGLTAATWSIRPQEHLAEFLGHMLWGLTIEIIRRDLRSRWTREPDVDAPPVALGAARQPQVA